ncbi:hypothetical protein GCM10027275_50290 [Rhabdobacter roseus]|uniref:Uncharacterized protein n=1 Tax=Rhabdobacter roseus TaxID=1655419 RepID=A0A840TT23_9BACT|nr:hypothetical protein [Rhabdobacter roseus]MBB5287101.1 hypothetical protein [Rhabdobacter roseus]
MSTLIKRKVAMAALRADDAQGQPSIHSIRYRKKDGTLGYKAHVSKSFRHLPGASKYRGQVSLNHEFLFRNHDESDPAQQHFRILIDLLVEVDGHIIDHTNGEYRS